MKSLETGLNYTAETVVTDQNTAEAYGSGNVAVFATPAMVALIENAARHAVAPALEPRQSTVGTLVNVTHVKATPVGRKVFATATLSAIEGRELIFEVSARDENGATIGQGTHRRFIIDVEKFLKKASNS